MSAEQIDAEKLAASIKFYDGEEVKADSFAVLLAAARAHLSTLPRVKEIDVWRVEYAYRTGAFGWRVPSAAVFVTKEDAVLWAARRDGDANISCITVTGPHKQKVPA